MEIQEVVNEKLAALISSGSIEEMVEVKVKSLMEKIVSDSLCRYSDFGKQLEKLVTSSLSLPENIELPEYNAAIIEIVTRQLESGTKSILNDQIAANLSNLLTVPPDVIKLSEFVESYKERVKAENHSDCSCDYGEHEIYVEIDTSDRFFSRVYLNDEPIKNHFDCQLQIHISHTREKIDPPCGEVYSVGFRDGKIESQLFRGDFYHLEKFLLQAKVANSKLLIDCDVHDLDLSYSTYED